MEGHHYDFEDEIITIQPNHHHIYEKLGNENQQIYPRPKEHLDKAAQARQIKAQYEKTLNHADQAKLKAIIAVEEIARTKPLGEQPTLSDWDTNENVEKETIAIMQYCGLISHGNEAGAFGTSNCTRQTLTSRSKNGILLAKNGNKSIPLLLDDKFFKMRPRKEAGTDVKVDEHNLRKDFEKLLLEQENETGDEDNDCEVIKSPVIANMPNKVSIPLALRRAFAAAQHPPSKNVNGSSSSNVSNSTQESLLDISSSSSGGSNVVSYASVLKKEKSSKATEQQFNILSTKDDRNKYLTPRELYLLKKRK